MKHIICGLWIWFHSKRMVNTLYILWERFRFIVWGFKINTCCASLLETLWPPSAPQKLWTAAVISYRHQHTQKKENEHIWIQLTFSALASLWSDAMNVIWQSNRSPPMEKKQQISIANDKHTHCDRPHSTLYSLYFSHINTHHVLPAALSTQNPSTQRRAAFLKCHWQPYISPWEGDFLQVKE